LFDSVDRGRRYRPMSSIQGCSPYCQECGACTARKPKTSAAAATRSHDSIIDSIVEEVVKTLKGQGTTHSNHSGKKIPLGVSNRHIHLQEQSFKLLFGANAQPEIYRELYQPGEFAFKQTCIIVGPKMKPIHSVRILGPFRKYDQVEVSFTDAISLGIDPPVKDSGDLSGAAPITIVGPAGSLVLREGAIIAGRHLHMTTSDAAAMGVASGQFVTVKIPGVKTTIYDNVLVRTNDAWKLQLHLDTDDANAAHVVCNQEALLIGQ
jgi:putative phosphotransacetylase